LRMPLPLKETVPGLATSIVRVPLPLALSSFSLPNVNALEGAVGGTTTGGVGGWGARPSTATPQGSFAPVAMKFSLTPVLSVLARPIVPVPAFAQ